MAQQAARGATGTGRTGFVHDALEQFGLEGSSDEEVRFARPTGAAGAAGAAPVALTSAASESYTHNITNRSSAAYGWMEPPSPRCCAACCFHTLGAYTALALLTGVVALFAALARAVPDESTPAAEAEMLELSRLGLTQFARICGTLGVLGGLAFTLCFMRRRKPKKHLRAIQLR